MIEKFNNLVVNPIKSILLLYKKKDIPCAWCYEKQSLYVNLRKDHICRYCGRVFYIKNNKDFKV